MKKILMCLGMILLISGCGDTTESLKCQSTTTSNGLTTDTTYDIKYKDDDIKYVTITYKYTQDEYTTQNDLDGVGTGTDGTTEDDDVNENDGIVDGVVGDAIDDGINAVTDTILDISGIKSTYENQFSAYDNMEGFEYKIDTNTDKEYTVIYNIDLEKISDTNLTGFNIDRKLANFKTTYQNQGYTCK